MHENPDPKIAEWERLKPHTLSCLRSFTFSQGPDLIESRRVNEHQATFIFARPDDPNSALLHVELLGVTEFRFEQPHLSAFEFWLEFSDIRDRQCEDLNYIVSSGEPDVDLSCVCRDFLFAFVHDARSAR